MLGEFLNVTLVKVQFQRVKRFGEQLERTLADFIVESLSRNVLTGHQIGDRSSDHFVECGRGCQLDRCGGLNLPSRTSVGLSVGNRARSVSARSVWVNERCLLNSLLSRSGSKAQTDKAYCRQCEAFKNRVETQSLIHIRFPKV